MNKMHFPLWNERGRAYCGARRPASELTTDWTQVTCQNCIAGARADRNGSLPRSMRGSLLGAAA